MNEYSCKIALRAAELEQKAIKLAKLTKKEKKGESISLLNSFIDLQMMNQKAMAAALDILPTKDVTDAYMAALRGREKLHQRQVLSTSQAIC